MSAASASSLKVCCIAAGVVAAGLLIYWWKRVHAPPAGEHAALAACEQLITVVTPDWPARDAVLTLWERDGAGWRQAGAAIPAVIGRSGLAWGRGLHEDTGGLPEKREGDGCAPAGIYSLGTIFGDTEPEGMPLRFPWQLMTVDFAGVDDPASRFYNQIVDAREVTKDWNSAEEMRRSDRLYHWGVVVNHNTAQVPGAGSCIFLHIWSGPGKGTAGCTAMREEDIERVIQWLDAGKSPRLVQLPGMEYQSRKAAWGLP